MVEPCPSCNFTGPFDGHVCEDVLMAREVARQELAEVCARVARRLDTGTPNLVSPVAQLRVKQALESEAAHLREPESSL